MESFRRSGPLVYDFKDGNCKGFQIPKDLAMRLSSQLMTHEETIRGMWSLLSLFEDFLRAKHDSFIYPLSEKYSIFFLAIKKVCNDFLDYFRYVSHDGFDTSHNTCPSWAAEWMSTAERRPRVNTFELPNVIEILNLKHYSGKMCNKPGDFPPKWWPLFLSQLQSWLKLFKVPILRKKFSASFAPTRNICLGASKCRSINGNQINKEFIEKTSCVLTQNSCNRFLCYPCKIKKYSELTLLRDCYRHHKGNLTVTWKFFLLYDVIPQKL